MDVGHPVVNAAEQFRGKIIIGPRLAPVNDDQTGLSLLGRRYYDTGTGRFLTRDPLGYAGGSNLYATARTTG